MDWGVFFTWVFYAVGAVLLVVGIYMAFKQPDALLTLDRRFIYAIVAFFVLMPLLLPLRLPVIPTPEVHGIYDVMDALPPGSHVLIAADFDPASKPELLPMLEAALAHCFLRELKPTVLTLWEAGPRLHQVAVEEQAARFNKASGTDYAWLGYRPGTSAVILGTVGSMTGTFKTDYYGRPTAGMPIFQEVQRLADYSYILDIAAGATVEAWVIYGAENAKVPIGASCTAVAVAQYYPFYQARQITGLSGGMRGSAEYEVLLHQGYGSEPDLMFLGDAMSGMNAQSMVHLFIVVSIILANIAYFISRRRPTAGRVA